MKIRILTILMAVFTIGMNYAQSIDQNYIKVTDYKEGYPTATVGNATSDQKIEVIQYFDGLGRPMQSINFKGGGNGSDLISIYTYDSIGRMDKEYLPVSIQSNGLNYNPIIDEDYINNKYDSIYPNEWPGSIQENAYSQKQFENSPLNRILKQGAPGEDWKLSGGHTIDFDYRSNGTGEVRLFSVSLASGFIPTLSGGTGYYSQNTLYKTITYDENHISGLAHSTEEFKDKQGRVVLKRTYADADLNEDGDSNDSGEANAAHDTYYVYDDYGNLTYVLPPKIEGHTAPIDSIKTHLDDLGYQYHYDQRNRLVEKKIPGKGKEYIIYDNLDRPVLTQDTMLKAYNQWLFTKYDVFGRVAYTGIYTHGSNLSRENMQSLMDSNRTTEASHYEERTGSGDHYSHVDFPSSNCEVLTLNYYDNYTFDLAGSTATVSSYGANSVANPKALATGSKTKVLDQTPATWITNVIYYDQYQRPIYNYTHNDYLQTTDIVETKLLEDSKPNDIWGLAHEIKTTHNKVGETIDIVTTENFTYDHIGRLVTQKQKINSQPEELIVLNEYDDLGQLKIKKVGGDVATYIENSLGLQTVNYEYNIRGWLKQINDPSSIGSDLFAYRINYNDGTGTDLYNGNISQTQWNTANTDNSLKTYTYGYDALNRITSGTDNTGHYNLSSVSYDKNGNIMSLNRAGNVVASPDPDEVSHWGIMDDLNYDYDPSTNLLKKVSDNGSSYGFMDGTNQTTEYSYDENGNLNEDKNKGISSISYNHLNLPTVINFGTSDKIEYIYDATGVKLSKEVTENNNTSTTDYAGNLVYKDGYLQFFNTPEGYVIPISESDLSEGFNYIYQYKDHLGNIRLSYTDVNQNIGAIELEIVEENNYYPFGLKHNGYNTIVTSTNPAQKYKYNGKEFQDELGLNMYDYGARMYDPALGRWFVNDRLADDEMQIDKSPYAYSWNSPISLNDPDGNCPWCIGALVGAVTEYAVQVTVNLAKGQTFSEAATNVDIADIGIAAGEGAITGGGSALRRILVSATSEVAKAAIDVTVEDGSIATDVLGTEGSTKTPHGVATDAAIGTIVGEGSTRGAKALVNASSETAVKTAKSKVTAAAKNLDKANNIRATGNSSQAARGSKAQTSFSAYKSFSAAKESQDVTKALNSTVGKASAETVEGTVEFTTSVGKGIIENKVKQ